MSGAKVLAGSVPSEGYEGEFVPCLSHGFYWLACDLWRSLASSSRGILPVSGFPLFIKTPVSHIGLGAHPTSA